MSQDQDLGEYVRVGSDLEMDRSLPTTPTPTQVKLTSAGLGEADEEQARRELEEEEDKQPVLSQVFQVDQVQQGLNNASEFFAWGFNSLRVQLAQGEEAARQLFESTQPQREAVAVSAAKIGQDIALTAELVRQESQKALQVIQSKVNPPTTTTPN